MKKRSDECEAIDEEYNIILMHGSGVDVHTNGYLGKSQSPRSIAGQALAAVIGQGEMIYPVYKDMQ